MATLTEAYWPADTSAPLRNLTVGGLLREAAADSPDAVALVAGVPGDDRRWTFGDVLLEAERAAAALLDRFEPGERVAVWARASPTGCQRSIPATAPRSSTRPVPRASRRAPF